MEEELLTPCVSKWYGWGRNANIMVVVVVVGKQLTSWRELLFSLFFLFCFSLGPHMEVLRHYLVLCAGKAPVSSGGLGELGIKPGPPSCKACALNQWATYPSPRSLYFWLEVASQVMLRIARDPTVILQPTWLVVACKGLQKLWCRAGGLQVATSDDGGTVPV